jgi:hypothetical protein
MSNTSVRKSTGINLLIINMDIVWDFLEQLAIAALDIGQLALADVSCKSQVYTWNKINTAGCLHIGLHTTFGRTIPKISTCRAPARTKNRSQGLVIGAQIL